MYQQSLAELTVHNISCMQIIILLSHITQTFKSCNAKKKFIYFMLRNFKAEPVNTMKIQGHQIGLNISYHI